MNAHRATVRKAASNTTKSSGAYCGPPRHPGGVGRYSRGRHRGFAQRELHEHIAVGVRLTASLWRGEPRRPAPAPRHRRRRALQQAARRARRRAPRRRWRPANSFANGRLATFQLGDVATAPVDGTGAAINLNQTAAQAAASMNCSLAVPANPLSAQGLATPWQLGDGCSMANAGTEGAFVEATILAPNGSLQVYSPLVVTAGTQPAVAPTAPTIAAGSAVDHQTSASTAPTWCSPAPAPGRATASTRSASRSSARCPPATR